MFENCDWLLVWHLSQFWIGKTRPQKRNSTWLANYVLWNLRLLVWNMSLFNSLNLYGNSSWGCTIGAVQLSQEKRIVINNLPQPLLISQLLKYHECHVNNFYGVYYIADLACPDMLSCVAMVTTRTF